MSSIATVSSVIERFLAREEAGVLALKGGWGTGKTYAWNEIIGSLRGQVRPRSYSYVSLFGLSSMSELRTAILANSRPSKLIGKRLTFDVINRNWRRLIIPQASRLFKWTSVGKLNQGVSVTLDAIAPMLIRDMVICIDDLERLDVKQISHDVLMGFVSNIKEGANCKVVLIMNDSRLPEGENAYLTYREKVVDVEILFNPTAEEAVEWGLSKHVWERERTCKAALALGIRNIRILKKISGVMEILRTELEFDLHDLTKDDVVRSVVLIAWCYFDKSGFAPSLEFLHKWDTMSAALKDGQEELTLEEFRWNGLLSAYRFFPFGDLDRAIEKVIAQGYPEESGVRATVEKLDVAHREGEKERQFADAWNRFRASFDNADEQKVIDGFRDAIKNATRQISPGNLDSAIRLLRELGQDILADELIAYYIEKRASEPDVFDPRHSPPSELTDGPTREAFRKAAATLAITVPLRQAVEKMARDNAWSMREQASVAAATADDFYQLFKGELSVPLVSAVDICLRLSQPGTEHVQERVLEALQRIGSESNINRVRVKRFGIDIGSEQTRKL